MHIFCGFLVPCGLLKICLLVGQVIHSLSIYYFLSKWKHTYTKFIMNNLRCQLNSGCRWITINVFSSNEKKWTPSPSTVHNILEPSVAKDAQIASYLLWCQELKLWLQKFSTNASCSFLFIKEAATGIWVWRHSYIWLSALAWSVLWFRISWPCDLGSDLYL